ncbi:MAG: hypothetical protein L3J35_08435 [Bacteroidales bacterium]|nr:hypothetical protein [Bacteroidales bacterium]
MKRKTILFSAGLFLLLFFSCDRNNILKVPVDLNFQFVLNDSKNINNSLLIKRGELIIDNFTFDGEREEGSDVFFSKTFPEGLKMISNSSSNIPELSFQIPQGIYSKISVSFETLKIINADDMKNTKDSYPAPCILIEGEYTNAGNEVFLLRFEFLLKEYFNIIATGQNENSSIVFNSEFPANAKIIINPDYWFQTITDTMLEEADVSGYKGPMPTILISYDNNEDIYSIVVNRIKDSVKIVIYS